MGNGASSRPADWPRLARDPTSSAALLPPSPFDERSPPGCHPSGGEPRVPILGHGAVCSPGRAPGHRLRCHLGAIPRRTQERAKRAGYSRDVRGHLRIHRSCWSFRPLCREPLRALPPGLAAGTPCVIPTGPTLGVCDPPWATERNRILRMPGLACMPCDKLIVSPNRCTNTGTPMACMDYWTVDKVERECRSVLGLERGYRS